MGLSSFHILGTVHYQLWGYQNENLKFRSGSIIEFGQAERKAVQAGLALYWWQRLITFDSSRLWVKGFVAQAIGSSLCPENC
jgi:hypothetical protein